MTETIEQASKPSAPTDPTEAVEDLLRSLRTHPEGLSSREAQRRLTQYGSNELERRRGAQWPRELARQFTHPLALLLWAAALLSFIVGSITVGVAVVLIIVLNAVVALIQERHAEKAVEALAGYIPQKITVMRDRTRKVVDAAELVPGDIALVEEGERIGADMRLISGAVEVDLSTITGESVPAMRSAEYHDRDRPRLQARELLFAGSMCTSGDAQAVVFATGMHTELGRIAALSQGVKEEPSPLDQQVRRVSWLIAKVAVALAMAFVPLAIFVTGLSPRSAITFAVGLLAGMVPEGLLPVITLSLAVAVTLLARRGAVVKRMSSVETLGSTDVICTDKTGTLTENRMHPVAIWTCAGEIKLDAEGAPETEPHAPLSALIETAASCSNARLDHEENPSGDPTEIAVLQAARALGGDVQADRRERSRRHEYNFDAHCKLMSTLDAGDGSNWLHTKGAPESVLPACTTVLERDGTEVALGRSGRQEIARRVSDYAGQGQRVLAFARRSLPLTAEVPAREAAEQRLCFVGLVTMLDPPRPEVADAIALCHTAGIRVIVITGDHPLTAAAIARRVGIGGEDPLVIDADRFDHRSEQEIERAISGNREVVFARASPEAKLQIAEALQADGHVISMTGDGVNDAPALRRADIGVAMGKTGTDVAREAATMVLTDDDFATIVTAVQAGRVVYDNIRKFIIYIFAHATPETLPFLVFALAGGAVPLPFPVLLLLAFDVGTETLPSLALSRDPPEPGIMNRPPRRQSEGLIRRPMLIRAWLFLGLIVAFLSLAGFFYVLAQAGWHSGDPTGAHTRFHHAYQQATTMTFLGVIFGQIGTAFAVRTQRASLRSVGAFSNRYLLWAIAGELAIAAVFVLTPPFQALLGTAVPPARDLLLLIPFPFIVLGADELRKFVIRARSSRRAPAITPPRVA
ncbi:MAG: cation-translocating P-type ATPase [Acidimicrobiales bacterium]